MKTKVKHYTSLILFLIVLPFIFSCNRAESDWKEADKKNSLEVYQDFINKYPENEHIKEALQKIEDLEWEKAVKENKIEFFSDFTKKYPQNRHQEEIQHILEQLEYELASCSDNRDSLISFLNQYPASARSSEIVEKIRGKASKNKVTYSYKSFWLYQVQDQQTGAWVCPTERVYYGEGFSDKTINATVNGKTYKCECLYQDIATFEKKVKIPVFAYQGCPFSLNGALSIQRDVRFDMPQTIVIDSTSDNILWVSKNSALPFLYNNGNLLSGYNSSLNISWLFLNRGELFFAGSDAYYISRDSATIEFTSTGIKLNGIMKFPK